MNFLLAFAAFVAGVHGLPLNATTHRSVRCSGGETKFILGYYYNWADYRANTETYTPENINPKLFTHLAYAYAVVESETFNVIPHEFGDNPQSDGGMYKRFNTHARKENPSIKTLISIGGWHFSQNHRIFNQAVNTPENREKFADSIIKFVRKHEFDGVDIDWQYPTPLTKTKFTSMLTLLRQKIKEEAASTGQPEMLLSIAASPDQSKIDERYEAGKIADLVDWIGLTTYDLFCPWDSDTRAHTQLFPLVYGELSVSTCTEGWAELVPYNKLLLGLATYGREFTLANPSETTSYSCNMGAASKHPGSAEKYSREAGYVPFYEIQQMINEGADVCEDRDKTKVVVLQSGSQWIGFDNEYSMVEKVRWGKTRGILGVMIWTVDTDDFNNDDPLITVITDEILGEPDETTTPSPASSTQTTTPSSSSSSSTTSSTLSITATSTSSSTSTYSTSSTSSSTSTHSTTSKSSSTSTHSTTSTSSTRTTSTRTTSSTHSSTSSASASESYEDHDGNCFAISPIVTDEWCNTNGCAYAYPQFCEDYVLPPSDGSGECMSTVSNISDEWCEANGCEVAQPVFCTRL